MRATSAAQGARTRRVRAEVADLFWGLYAAQREAWIIRALYRQRIEAPPAPKRPPRPRKPRPNKWQLLAAAPRGEERPSRTEADNAIAKALRPKLPPSPRNGR